MGMYDTLNGEQVKAFPWYSFDASDKRLGSAIVGHGGDLAYYSSKKHKEEYENWKKKNLSETDLEDMKKIGSTPKKIEDDAVPYRSFSRNYRRAEKPRPGLPSGEGCCKQSDPEQLVVRRS